MWYLIKNNDIIQECLDDQGVLDNLEDEHGFTVKERIVFDDNAKGIAFTDAYESKGLKMEMLQDYFDIEKLNVKNVLNAHFEDDLLILSIRDGAPYKMKTSA